MTKHTAPLPVLFDATRLLARGTHSTPTGIDRVDLAYVDAVRSDPAFDLRLVRFDARGPQLLTARQADPLIEAVLQRWRHASSSVRDEALRAWLASPPMTPRPAAIRRSPAPANPQRLWQAMRSSIKAFNTPRLPSDSPLHRGIYLNTSHGQLYRPVIAHWLAQSGIAAVFAIQDLIPIEFPEYNRPREPARHRARLQTVGRHARQVLVSSEATATALRAYWQAQAQIAPPISVIPLGIDIRPDAGLPVQAAHPYFVVLGTLEPRKNHLLLLQCWRRLIEQDASKAPRLVLIGRRGWENQSVFQLLDRASVLERHVIECSDLSDGEVSSLIRGARALLMPSHAEGYGLPVVEALSLGTPVLASDIPSHREIAGEFAEYLDPLDGCGWLNAIRDYAAESSIRREQRHRRLPHYLPPSWDAHFATALPLLEAAAASA